MKTTSLLPVLHIHQFEDYNNCLHCGNSFYIRPFNVHLQEHDFLEPAHSHDFFIVLLITQGSGEHYIDFNTYEIKPGVLFFISPGQVHSWSLSADVDGYILFFTREYFLLGLKDNTTLSRLPFFFTHINKPCMVLEEMDQPRVTGLFQSLLQEYVERETYYHDMIRLSITMLLTLLERRYTTDHKGQDLKPYAENLLHTFEALIEQHYKEHWSASVYAEKMNISLKQLNSICKKAVSKTPGELILDRIILEGKRLLLHSDNTVYAIAHILNYTDDSYFIRLFKKYTAVTPEQFRTQLQT